MNRRQVLAWIGTGAIIGLAGCNSGAESSDAPDRASPSPTTTTNESAPSDPTVLDHSCPPYDTARDRAVCSQTVDKGSEPVYLEPTPVQSTLDDGIPTEEITLTLHNQSPSDLSFNPHSWRIRQKADSDWVELEQQLSGNGKLTISPNDTHSWSLTEALESIREDPEFETGLYAAELGVPDPDNDDAWVACIALVHLGTAG